MINPDAPEATLINIMPDTATRLSPTRVRLAPKASNINPTGT